MKKLHTHIEIPETLSIINHILGR